VRLRNKTAARIGITVSSDVMSCNVVDRLNIEEVLAFAFTAEKMFHIIYERGVSEGRQP
jgi:hypothetical protein